LNNKNITIELATPTFNRRYFNNADCTKEYKGWPKSNEGQINYLIFAFDSATNQKNFVNTTGWSQCYAQNFQSRDPSFCLLQIEKFFSSGDYRKLRPGLQEDLDYINKYNPSLTEFPRPSDISTLKPYTSEEIKSHLIGNLSTLYSESPDPWFFFPWRINDITIKLPPGNYSSKSNRKGHTGCIEDTVNSQLYNAGLDPKYSISYTVNPIDGKSIFSRPSTLPEIITPDLSQNFSEISGNTIDPSHNIQPMPFTKEKWVQVNSAYIPLLPNLYYDFSGTTQVNGSPVTTPRRGEWFLGAPSYCYTFGIPLINSFNIKFNVSTDGTPDVEQPLPLKLGWQLGFRAGSYGLCEVAISEGICLITGPRYIYFCINDFTNASNNYFRAAFAESILSPHILGRINYSKLQQDAGAFGLAEDDDYNNSLNRTREYFGPTEIQRLHFQIIDEYGRVVRFNNMDWSCAIMFDVLYD
jgi:hypothetical protein